MVALTLKMFLLLNYLLLTQKQIVREILTIKFSIVKIILEVLFLLVMVTGMNLDHQVHTNFGF